MGMKRKLTWGRLFEHKVVAWLRAERERQGISQTEVADMLGKKRPAVSEIEAGRQRLTVADLHGYGLVLNAPVSYMIEQAVRPRAGEPRKD